jgi:uncharacterized membrane protein YphA (DoxX/SURF4 family)
MGDDAGVKRRRMIVLALRIVLGCVWLYAAYTKLKDSWVVFAMSIDAYQMLPDWAPPLLARSLPWVELAIGLLLLAGLWLRYVSVAGAAILVVFFTVMSVAALRHLQIDCGCFGPGDKLSALTLLRDGTLLAAAVALVFLSRRRPVRTTGFDRPAV